MSYPINYPTPQNANVQIFQYNLIGGDLTARTSPNATWVKPQGASFVWFTLIGAGGNGDGTTGGGSGSVTNFMCPAFLIPDSLQVMVANLGSPSIPSQIIDKRTDTTLLQAQNAAVTNGAPATAANYFTAMGFYQSTAGDNGSSTNVPASTTTFLSVGGLSSQTQASNYGYTTGTTGNRNGFFQMQPIIVGAGGMGTGNGGIGCGGGVDSGKGGNGLVVIITW